MGFESPNPSVLKLDIKKRGIGRDLQLGQILWLKLDISELFVCIMMFI